MIDINKNQAFYNALKSASKNPTNTGVNSSECLQKEINEFYKKLDKSKTIKTIITKVFSYSNDFNEEEQEILRENNGYDCYIEYQAFTKEYLDKKGYSSDKIANKLIELGCCNNETVLIHLNW